MTIILPLETQNTTESMSDAQSGFRAEAIVHIVQVTRLVTAQAIWTWWAPDTIHPTFPAWNKNYPPLIPLSPFHHASSMHTISRPRLKRSSYLLQQDNRFLLSLTIPTVSTAHLILPPSALRNKSSPNLPPLHSTYFSISSTILLLSLFRSAKQR